MQQGLERRQSTGVKTAPDLRSHTRPELLIKTPTCRVTLPKPPDLSGKPQSPRVCSTPYHPTTVRSPRAGKTCSKHPACHQAPAPLASPQHGHSTSDYIPSSYSGTSSGKAKPCLTSQSHRNWGRGILGGAEPRQPHCWDMLL